MVSDISTGFTIVFGIATYTNTLSPNTGAVINFSPAISLDTVTNLLCCIYSDLSTWAELQFIRQIQTEIGIWRLGIGITTTPSGLTVYYQNIGY